MIYPGNGKRSYSHASHINCLVSISRSFYDDYRYVNFTSALVNTDDRFDLRDGIYKAPYSGTYLFSVHGLPMRKRPFRLQAGNLGLFATHLKLNLCRVVQK